MRILILNQSFYPDVVSVAQHAADLARALTVAGHAVTVVSSRRAYTDPTRVFPAREEVFGCSVRRLRSLGLGKKRPWRRVADSLALIGAYCLELIRLPRFDVVLAMTHPPLISTIAAIAVLGKGGKLVCWIMDLNPDEAIAAGWLRADSCAARILRSALGVALRVSSRVVVLDRFMRERMLSKGVAERRLAVLPPWSHDDVVRYDPAGRDALRESWGLADKFVVMYSGNMSPVHPLDTLLDAAKRLAPSRDIVFCFVGDGNGLPKLREFASANGLQNIVALPYQPLNRLSASLSVADLHVVAMGDAMVGIVHPCKIYNILAVGLPFLHIGPDDNHITDIISGIRTPGAATSASHGDVDRVTDVILGAAARRLGVVPELVTCGKRFSAAGLAADMVAILEEAACSEEQAEINENRNTEVLT